MDTLAPVPKCLGQFGTKVHEALRDPELKDASTVVIVLRNVDHFIFASVMEWKCLEND